MSMASVTMRPVKPSSLAQELGRWARDRVAGVPVGSRAGTAMCPIITASTPASTALRKGSSSTAVEPLAVAADRGELQVAVDRGVAVAREVLGRGEQAAGARARGRRRP